MALVVLRSTTAISNWRPSFQATTFPLQAIPLPISPPLNRPRRSLPCLRFLVPSPSQPPLPRAQPQVQHAYRFLVTAHTAIAAPQPEAPRGLRNGHSMLASKHARKLPNPNNSFDACTSSARARGSILVHLSSGKPCLTPPTPAQSRE